MQFGRTVEESGSSGGIGLEQQASAGVVDVGLGVGPVADGRDLALGVVGDRLPWATVLVASGIVSVGGIGNCGSDRLLNGLNGVRIRGARGRVQVVVVDISARRTCTMQRF